MMNEPGSTVDPQGTATYGLDERTLDYLGRQPVLIDTGGAGLRGCPYGKRRSISDAVLEAMMDCAIADARSPALVKVHIGERRCTTGMLPWLMDSSARFALSLGIPSAFAGDSTVAYTGPRGHKQNPVGSAEAYLQLAESRGWTKSGEAGIPFAVIDRPSTFPGEFPSSGETEITMELEGLNRFRTFFLSPGFHEAGTLINHAHLTLHGLAGLAGCTKSIAMGLSSLSGKLRMHQHLLPKFDAELCRRCKACVLNCPEEALSLGSDDPVPTVDEQVCIGCGECEAVCAALSNAVTLEPTTITDWQRGEDTLPYRMADYAMGLMHGRWTASIHVLHLYDVTERCDCLNISQKPFIDPDIGIIVGTNPFAIDMLAGRLLAERIGKSGRDSLLALIGTAEKSAEYVHDQYGVPIDTSYKTQKVKNDS